MQHRRRQRVKNAACFPFAELWIQPTSENSSANNRLETLSAKKILCGLSTTGYTVLIKLQPVSLPLCFLSPTIQPRLIPEIRLRPSAIG